MKLSKKVVVIFLISTLVTLIVYTVASNFTMKALYGKSGESTRISGISGGAINRFKGEINKAVGKSREYASLISTSRMVKYKYKPDETLEQIEERMGITEKVKRDGYQYKVYLNNKEEGYSVDTNYSTNVDPNILNKILEIGRSLITIPEKPVDGVIDVYGKKYFISISPTVDGRSTEELKIVRGYFIIAQPLDEKFAKIVSDSMGRAITLEDSYDKSNPTNYTSKTNVNEDITIVTDDQSVSSYYKIVSLNGGEDLYLSTTEELEIKKNTEYRMVILTIVLAGIIIIINLIICYIIEKTVVRRIAKINKGVNNIRESKKLSDRIEEESGQDELSTLSKDINYMINSLEESNNLIFEKDKKYGKLLNSLTNGYLYFKVLNDKEGNFKDAVCVESNDATELILKSDKKVLDKKSIKEIIPIFDDGKIDLESILVGVIATGEPYINEEIEIKKGVWVSIGIYSIEEGYFACIITDITKSKRYSEDMKFLANYDTVTTLLNRYSLYNYMEKLKRDEKPFTVYFIDLDNFKNLNDTLGHSTGDEVLCGAASALLSIQSDSLTVGRLGGDEFIVIKEGEIGEEEIFKVGREILSALNQTFKYKNYTYQLKGSVGVSSYPRHADDIETLLQYADIAMYKSKKNGGNRVNVISDDMLEDIIIEGQLKEALKKKEFLVYYQPIYNIEQNKIVGAEALVRWEREGEIVAPNKFIPIAKKSGDICDIDNFVLRKACEFCKACRDAGNENFKIAINASYMFLKQPKLKEDIKSILEELNLPANALKLEITEDEILDDPKYIIKILKDIKKLGVKVSLDDFGVGYSSFNHIKMLPIDTIKIDRSLLLKVEEDEKSIAIIETLIQLAHTLELDVICEGVEEQDQLDLLKDLNCDKIQGYFISRPIEEDKFKDVIDRFK